MKLTLTGIFAALLIISSYAQDKVFKVAQVMPRLEACKDMQEPMEVRICMQEKLDAAIAAKLKYPNEAEEAGQEGVALVTFIIRKDGSMDQLTIAEDPGFGLGDAAMKAVSKTKRNWVAGSNFGEPVDVEMTVPVHFDLPGKKSAEEEMTVKAEEPEFYTVVDEMPRFHGCGEVSADLATACTRDLSIAYIKANIKYPEAAKEKNLDGDVHAEFIVDEAGNVTRAKIIKSLSEETDAEVLRLLEEMPVWIPGKQLGKTVKVKMTMPFRFRPEKTRE